jgi:hypothetical protein
VPVTIGPCDWDIPDPTCCPKWEADTTTQAEKDRARRLASWFLWTATGRQLGQCTTAVRPCRRSCPEANGGWPVRPDGRTVTYGRWMAQVLNPAIAPWAGGLCGCGQHTCSCGKLCEIHLPGTAPEPVEVIIDGQVIPLDRFRVDNGHWLVWTGEPFELPDGRELTCFPTCQDLAAPVTDCGTWQITYRHGLPVPDVVLDVASELLCEVLKACAGASPSECRLPANVVSMTRAGVSYDFAANSGTVTNPGGRILRFNIPAVDMLVQSINPYGVTDVVRAWSPDLPEYGRVQTWP